MTKNVKRFFSMLLALSLVFSLVVPAAATETDDQLPGEASEVVQDVPVATEAAEETTIEASEEIHFEVSLDNYTLNAEEIEFNTKFDTSLLWSDLEDVEVDREDPAILTFETELKAITVLDEGTGEAVPLTDAEIEQILQYYSVYQQQWGDNADLLGVQIPFFLDHNDGEGLGMLGEMLALANIPVAAVKSGMVSFNDLMGMIDNFYYADMLGLQYYGEAIRSARDEVLELIEESGAQTEAQKLLVLNDWMAHINTFDMPYIMNSGKENPPMVAPDPQDRPHYDDVYQVLYGVYEDRIEQMVRAGIVDGIKADFYKGAIKDIVYQMELAKYYEDETVVGQAMENVDWAEAYEEALAAEEKKVYDEAYNEYLLNNHEHELTVNFGWEEVKAEDETTVIGYTCESAEATCSVGGCTAELTATVELEKDETTNAATCTEAGKTVYTATATVTTDATGETVAVGEPVVETREVAVAALGHVDADADNKCDRCEAEITPAHVHNAVVTITWEANNDATASVVCGEGCDGVTVETPVVVTSENTKEATCGEAGVTTYTASVTVTDSKGNAVEATVNNATKTAEIPATGEHTYEEGKNGKCDVCGFEHTEHVDVADDDDGYCDICYADMPVEHSHAYTESVTTAATCTAEGVKTFTCECGNSYTEVISATGHDYDRENPVIVDSTCTAEGTKTYTCKNGCGVADVETIAVKEHTYVNGTCSCGAVCTHVDVDNDYLCDVCGGTYTPSSPSAIPEDVTFDAVTLAEDGDDTTTGDDTNTDPVDPDVDPDADKHAKEAVKAKEKEIKAAAEAKANEETGLQAEIKRIVEADDKTTTEYETAAQTAAEGFMAENEEAINEDPVAFVDSNELFQTQVPVTDGNGDYILDENNQPVMMTLAEQIHAAWADAEENGIDMQGNGQKVPIDTIVDSQMDEPIIPATDADGNPVMDENGQQVMMTPNQQIAAGADQAASGLADGVIDYWEGSQYGTLGMGTSVCLGYTKAFTYLVQCMHPEIYLKDGATDIDNAENWKTAQDLYYDADGNLDINQNYVVDAVRVTFDASVTMFGQTEDNFNSDHFWNAVKVDGQWYYIDPCYTDVFTEVMMRDRVETDGQMNHLYFLFSHTSCVELYEGNYSEIKTLYEDVATNEQYEDSWMSRIKSNTYFSDGYAYYMYDSTDMLELMEEYENQNTEADIEDPLYKIVRHQLDTNDTDNGDTDYETLITFNYTEDDDSEAVATVYDPEAKATVDNELLTELWHKHAEYAEIYPSIMITAALYDGKVYFNLANCILSYDIATSEVAVVKEYNTVYGVRDDTNPFGGMAFTTTSSADSADFTVENHPIAGMTIKDDGNMYVSVATNFAFISGKSDRTDPASDGYGYEYEESNYNSDYNSYMDYSDYDDDELESYGYTKEINDNDEFMWTANFVEKLSMSHLAGSHSYASVSVAATCGVDAYTENRCTECGAIETDTRVYEEGTACEHHYVMFEETFYTKDDAGRWNTGVCYVCTVCGNAVTEPVEPTGQAATDEAMAEYEEALAIYEAAKESAGHTYVPTGETWAEDNSTVTFNTLVCSSVCPERKPYLDCLLNDSTITITLETEVTADAALIGTTGTCPEGVVEIYEATGEVEVDGETVTYTITKEVAKDPADCSYVDGVCTVCGDCTVKRVYGESRADTALEVAKAMKEALGVEKFDTIIIANGEDKNFADALTGSYLANVKNAPILMYRTSGLSESTMEYIQNNLSENGTVYLLGGENAIPASVGESLAAYTIKRLAGTSRMDTNLEILKEAGVGSEEILIARGYEFADSLSASATGKPILLVNEVTGKLTEAQITFLSGLNGNKLTILGGTLAISEELEAAIEEVVGTDVDRVYGTSREDTSVAIAKRYFEAPSFAVVAYSRKSPDGLCGGPLAYAMDAPLLLTNAGKEESANTYITETGIEAGYVLGGTLVITDETARAVFGLPENAVIAKK